MGGRAGKESLGPVFVNALPIGSPAVTGRHAQHIPDGQAQQLSVRVFGQPILKKVHDMIVQAEFPIVDQHAHSNARHGFADGIHAMGDSFLKRSVISLRLFLTVDRQDKAVHVHIFFLKPFHKGVYTCCQTIICHNRVFLPAKAVPRTRPEYTPRWLSGRGCLRFR